MELPPRYKHSAPLEPGRKWNASALQAFGSAGAGEDMECLGATNIRLRWSRGGYEIASALQTFGSAGAAEDMKLPPRYKHSAPLEPGRI